MHHSASSTIIACIIGLLITAQTAHSDQSNGAFSEKPGIKSLVPSEKHKGAPPLPISKGRFMFSVSLHKEQEIDSLLTRADELSKVMRTNGNESRIALILHGPEIKFFTKQNYGNHRQIVDRAAKLNNEKIIEIKICKSKMKEYGIKDAQIPSFVEIIPYAPDEERGLLKQES